MSYQTIYYRLQEYDLDNNSLYSDVVKVPLRNVKALTLFPNPATSVINLQGDGITQIQVVDNSGKTLILQKENDVNSAILNISKLASGIYHVIVSNSSGKVQTSNLVVR